LSTSGARTWNGAVGTFGPPAFVTLRLRPFATLLRVAPAPLTVGRKRRRSCKDTK
jgi:hypothetical protein